MNFLKRFAFQFWPLALMAAVIWTLPEKYHHAIGHGWGVLLAGFMIAGGVMLWSMASRSLYEAVAYRKGRNCYIQGLKLQIDYTRKSLDIVSQADIPGLVESYGELLDKQKGLLRHAEQVANEEDGK